MTTLREQATAAHQATQADQVAAARDALATVLAPFDPAPLEVAAVEDGAGFRLVVLTDDDIYLAVRQRGEQWSVALLDDDTAEGWTELAQITSLAQLGELLPLHDPADPETTSSPWVQPTGAHDAYDTGDRVTYQGATWESTINGNVWAPGVSGWRVV